MDHHLIIKEIEKGSLEKVYFLHGEEPYFIDAICDAIVLHGLDDSERDFNQTILYGKDATTESIIAYCREFPMMARRKLVIIKEAQYYRKLEELLPYMEHPTESTVLVICYKHDSYDSRKKIMKEAAKQGIVFKSEKVADYKLTDWIEKYVRQCGYGITPKASIMLGEFLGNDLGRIVNELDKLQLLVEKGTTINDIHIEENIGISKDYNIYELVNAISIRDSVRSNTIVDYFVHNPKAGEMIPVISSIFNQFEKFMWIHFSENKSKENVAAHLKVHPFVAGKLIEFAKYYTPKKIAANVAILHEYDLKSKGINNATSDHGQLMKEMIFRLLN